MPQFPSEPLSIAFSSYMINMSLRAGVTAQCINCSLCKLIFNKLQLLCANLSWIFDWQSHGSSFTRREVSLSLPSFETGSLAIILAILEHCVEQAVFELTEL